MTHNAKSSHVVMKISHYFALVPVAKNHQNHHFVLTVALSKTQCTKKTKKTMNFEFSQDVFNTVPVLTLSEALPSKMVMFFRVMECSQSFRRRSSVMVLRISISFLSWASVLTWVTHKLLVSSVMLLIWIWRRKKQL